MFEDPEEEVKEITLRVYGILIDPLKGVLVSDELERGKYFSKFPGGGLEPGEGTIDCLLREWMEELGQRIEVIKHFYTTDFFQRSVFDPHKQVISIYYLIKALEEMKGRISEKPFENSKEGSPSFRWIKLEDFSEDNLTFPIDKLVAGLISADRTNR